MPKLPPFGQLICGWGKNCASHCKLARRLTSGVGVTVGFVEVGPVFVGPGVAVVVVVAVAVGVGVAVMVGEAVKVGVGVLVRVSVGVGERVGVAVRSGVKVSVGVGVTVSVGVGVAVNVGVRVGVGVGVSVKVGVGVAGAPGAAALQSLIAVKVQVELGQSAPSVAFVQAKFTCAPPAQIPTPRPRHVPVDVSQSAVAI